MAVRATPLIRRDAAALLAALAIATPSVLGGQDEPSAADTASRAPGGGQVLVPLGSLLLPGLGQYLRGAPLAGAAFTGTAVLGYALYFTGDTAAVSRADLPRHGDGQQAVTGLQFAAAAGGVSAYDAFRRVLPALQREGKYGFATRHERTAQLLTAPFDPRFLTRWTTWIDLAHTAVVAIVILNGRERGVAYEPYKARDAAFITGLSLTAGFGEEAIFRGWLLPVLHETTGGQFWLSNGIQATLFGGLHVPSAREFAAVITAWAVYEGWLTRRNSWSVRESIFHHVWYDMVIGTAEFLADERAPAVVVRFPPISF